MMRRTLSSDADHHGNGWLGERQIVPAEIKFTSSGETTPPFKLAPPRRQISCSDAGRWPG
jgi:hypothetical protein